MKNKFLLSLAFLFIFILGGCATNTSKNVPMDQLADDGFYHYSNEKSAFSVDFPEQFIYYQTQRKDTSDYQEVQFFVPTSDRDYPQEIQSYARFLTVRVYDDKKYKKQDNFVEIGEKNNKKYVAIFWDIIPRDWSKKWNDETKTNMISSFKLN